MSQPFVAEEVVALAPNQKLLDHTRAKGWKIVIEPKNVVYILEKHDTSCILA
jgi:hypothetical protein